MIEFVSTSITISLKHTYYSAIADLHNLQFTVIHALGFSVFTSRLLATDLKTETSNLNHYEVSYNFLWNHPGTSELNSKISPGLPSRQSESEILYDWRFTTNQLALALSPLRLTARYLFHLNTCGHSPYVTSSLTRGWVCRIQLLLAIASSFILRS
jgi:hypothetical protein